MQAFQREQSRSSQDPPGEPISKGEASLGRACVLPHERESRTLVRMATMTARHIAGKEISHPIPPLSMKERFKRSPPSSTSTIPPTTTKPSLLCVGAISRRVL